MAGSWGAGELSVRREVLGLGPHGHRTPRPAWLGRPWEGVPVYVVEDTGDQLVTWISVLGAQLVEQLDAGRHRWDPEWGWAPPTDWRDVGLPADWSSTPCPSS